MQTSSVVDESSRAIGLADVNDVVLRSGYSTSDQQQVIISLDVHDSQVHGGDAFVSQLAGHALAFDDSAGIGSATGGTSFTNIFAAVCYRTTVESPAFDGATEALSFAGSDDVHAFSNLEDIRLDFIAKLKIIDLVNPHLAQNLKVAFAHLIQVTLQRAIGVFGLSRAECELHSRVAVTLQSLDLGYGTRSGLHHSDWHHTAILCENLGHSNFASDNCSHHGPVPALTT
jgi:hypothetical protein